MHRRFSERSLSVVGVRATLPADGATGDREWREAVRDDAFNWSAHDEWQATILGVRHDVGHSGLCAAGERLVHPEHRGLPSVPSGGEGRTGWLRHGQGGVHLRQSDWEGEGEADDEAAQGRVRQGDRLVRQSPGDVQDGDCEELWTDAAARGRMDLDHGWPGLGLVGHCDTAVASAVEGEGERMRREAFPLLEFPFLCRAKS